MNKMQIFNNPEFGKLRMVDMDGQPWLVGRDVAEALGYAKPENALATHVDDEDKTTTLIQGNGSNYKSKITIINESGLYSLVLSSKLPGAKRFKRWVTSEVLPSIRKNGGYLDGQAELGPDEILAKAVLVAQRVIEEQQRKIGQMEPKALFADAVSASKSSVLVGDMAKLLRQNGIDMGQRRLFEWLRQNGYLMRQRGASWNMPTQRSMDMGLFEIKETAITHSDGSVTVSKTVKVTGDGQIYFVNKFLKGKQQAAAPAIS